MARQHNTNRNGGSWSEQEKRAVWQKGSVIEGYDSSLWRRDICGHAMKYTEHGNRDSDYGWEIDHIKAVANGGDDNISNLQPLYWGNNSSKGDKLNWRCGQ
ncbi:MAG: HNH endonuclease [Chitinophagales bacterium]|uniref:HNH endonuclease signature motif containing protein n=1 Tax=Flavobacterium filum TaxID=370974 RepID=UPI001AD29547|nr:HNH endonuclease signature motif containing protein [Flavobacterium filum]MBN8665627.1 HNH endonuclease [Chitinophagales bacterium]